MVTLKGRHTPKLIILQCVRWYCSYALSYRNIEEMMANGRNLFESKGTVAGIELLAMLKKGLGKKNMVGALSLVERFYALAAQVENCFDVFHARCKVCDGANKLRLLADNINQLYPHK